MAKRKVPFTVGALLTDKSSGLSYPIERTDDGDNSALIKRGEAWIFASDVLIGHWRLAGFDPAVDAPAPALADVRVGDVWQDPDDDQIARVVSVNDEDNEVELEIDGEDGGPTTYNRGEHFTKLLVRVGQEYPLGGRAPRHYGARVKVIKTWLTDDGEDSEIRVEYEFTKAALEGEPLGDQDEVALATWLDWMKAAPPEDAPTPPSAETAVGSLWKSGPRGPKHYVWATATIKVTKVTGTHITWRGHDTGVADQDEKEFKKHEETHTIASFKTRWVPANGTTNTDSKETDTMAKNDEGKSDSEEDMSKFKDVGVARHSDGMIVLPEGMSKKAAASWLTRLDKEDEREVSIHHEINAYPLEGAYALYRALQDKFGFVSLEATPGFFGPKPPTMVGLDIGVGKRVNVPWGRIVVPGVSGHLETNAVPKKNGEVIFVLTGLTTRRDEDKMNEIVALVRRNVSSKSIYRGKAIMVSFPEGDGFDFAYTPKFMDTSKTNPSELIFPKDVRDLVETSLFAPIEHADVARALKIPLKRGILLEGPYGCGKTLTAYVTAKKCEQSGWSFIYLDKTSDLKRAIALARQYEPCVIFAEDIDRVVEGGERSAQMDDILNTIDGIDGKASEIMVVLTTNHVEKINRAMLRPGRLDCIIPVRAPDPEAAMGLIKLYARGLIKEGEDLSEVGKTLDGQIPAVLRETVERAKLGAIVHLTEDTPKIELTAKDLLVAARSMLVQLNLMQVPVVDARSNHEKSASIIADAVRNGIEQLAHAVDGSLYTTEKEPEAEAKPVNGAAAQPTA